MTAHDDRSWPESVDGHPSRGHDRHGHDVSHHDHGDATGTPVRSESVTGHEHGGHSHGVAADANVRYLGVALGLIVGFMIVEVVVAVLSGSLVLLADAGHMLTDAGAIAASLWAIRLAARPATDVWTYGLKRAEILSAAGNGITLVAVAAVITVEGIRRLITPPAWPAGRC